MTAEGIIQALKPTLPDDKKIERLRLLREDSWDLRRVLDVFSRHPARTFEVTVDDVREKGGFGANGDVHHAFRKLEEEGWGRFKAGRRGHKSRFSGRWELRGISELSKREELKELPVAVEAESSTPFPLDATTPVTNRSAVAPPVITTATSAKTMAIVEHSYNLRPDFAVHIELPGNLTPAEASRLAAFIQTLPF